MAGAGHLHEEFPQLCDIIIMRRRDRDGPLLALLDEVPQTHVVQELQTEKHGVKKLQQTEKRELLRNCKENVRNYKNSHQLHKNYNFKI